MSGVTTIDNNSFHPLYSLKRFKATGLGAAGLNNNLYLRHGMMSAAALDELFTNLADISALPSRSITISLQPGRATANTSIATAKGWTVIV